MEKINTFDDLKLLHPKEKFYLISEGTITGYIFCSINPMSESIVVTINDSNYKKATCFSEIDFKYGKRVFIKGVYESSEVGGIMISQLEDRISSVDKIWMSQIETSNQK